MDWKRSIMHRLRLKQQFGIDSMNEVKIFFRDDSWILARRQTNNSYKIDLWLEVAGPLKKGWWKNKDYSNDKYSILSNHFKNYFIEQVGMYIPSRNNIKLD